MKKQDLHANEAYIAFVAGQTKVVMLEHIITSQSGKIVYVVRNPINNRRYRLFSAGKFKRKVT